jgi:carboxyl-terminal processing protease
MGFCGRAVLAAVSLATPLLVTAQTSDDFAQDFETMWRRTASIYAYFDTRATAWAEMPKLYADDLRRVKTRDEFVVLLEQVIDELYDPHAQLNTNSAAAYRLVPSGADLWAEWNGGRAVITDVRADSDAQRAGIRPNDVVVSINSSPIGDSVDARIGRSYSRATAPAREWALRSVLAGRHNTPRRLEIQRGDNVRIVELAARNQFATSDREPVRYSQVAPDVGYMRVNDSLGGPSTIEAFDRALGELRNTRGLILDLRDTPSGGNTVVAKGILGRFVSREQPYQKHELPSEERNTGVRRSWLELVSPRGNVRYQRPVVVLVGRWTGSMGEGLAIGFDATAAGTVVGTAMAGLVGATNLIMLPRTKIGVNVPAERLYHVNGTPREAFRPRVPVDVTQQSGTDPFIAAALRVLR